jgi:lysophospholipase L1-like esterase
MTAMTPLLLSLALQNPSLALAPQDADWWRQRFAVGRAKTGFEVAFLGDSITQGWESVGPIFWERDFGGMRAANFGYSGDRTENVLWRLENGEMLPAKPKVVVMMIGTNNVGHGVSNAVQTSEGVRAIVAKIRKASPGTKILLLGIFPRESRPDAPLRRSVVEATAGFKGVADGRNVVFKDLSAHFLRADGTLRQELMPDALHLNEGGYDLWARAIREDVRRMLGERPETLRGNWETLFDGVSLKGWTQRYGTATYRVENGTIVGKTTKGSPNSFLCTDKSFGDFEMEFEVKCDPKLNSGVQVRSLVPGGAATGHLQGPQVEIEASPGAAGFIYGEDTSFGWLSTEPRDRDPRVNRHFVFRNDGWNHYRVVAQGPRFRTWINGVPIADTTHEPIFRTHATGMIGLQVHSIGPDEGPYEVAWRKLRVRSLR